MSDVFDKTVQKPDARNIWIIDVFVLVFFISTAISGLYLFRRDLMKTIEARNAEPVGIIIIRNNVVQRRHEDRMIWDRLYVDSFVYSGDLVRAAEISSASIHIEENKIDLNENTLIRIQYSTGKAGPLEIELKEGNISLTSGAKGDAVFINLMGNKVYTSPGTVVNAAASPDGIKVQVNEGSAKLISDGQTRTLEEGNILAKDSQGAEQAIPAVVVKRPAPNANFIKNTAGLLPVNYIWTRINLADDEKIRLEISGDPGFSQGVYAIDNLGSQARAVFDTGIWQWRLCAGDTVLSTGQLTVADGSGPELLSPVTNSVIRYKGNMPQIRYQWTQRTSASQYNIEISDTQDFKNLKVNKQLSSASFIYSGLGDGIWYWRVRPVFSSAWEGSASFSDSGSFTIEEISVRQESSAAAIIEVEVPDSALASAPVPVSVPVRRMPVSNPPVIQFAAVPVSPPPAGVPAAKNNAPPSSRVYVVQTGDTLGRIAARFYGDPFKWPLLVEANDIKNPDLIYVDQALFVP